MDFLREWICQIKNKHKSRAGRLQHIVNKHKNIKTGVMDLLRKIP